MTLLTPERVAHWQLHVMTMQRGGLMPRGQLQEQRWHSQQVSTVMQPRMRQRVQECAPVETITRYVVQMTLLHVCVCVC